MSDQHHASGAPATMSYSTAAAAATTINSKRQGLMRSLSSEVHCDQQRIRCKMGYLFALMLLLASLSIWTNVFFMRRSRLSEMEGVSRRRHFEIIAANDIKLAEVAADLNLAGFERHESRVVVSQTTTVERTSRQETPLVRKNIKKLRNRKYAPKIKPRAESLSSNSSFSACMLIKDDNEILSEWIAYHYFVLKLRKMIIAIDPLSTESPSEVLDLWRKHTDMEIIEWHDPDYMPTEFVKNGYPPAEYLQKQSDFTHEMTAAALLEISNHRYRQRVFLAMCMKEHRRLGASWVIHIDTDEYVIASKLLREVQPDYLKIPSLEEPGSMFHLLQQVVAKTPAEVSYPCMSMLRLLFGSVESKPERITKMVPSGFNATEFETLRWRYHALPHNMSYHGNPKVIVDVAAIPEEYFPDVVYSIHRPVEAYCPKNKELEYTEFKKQPIGVNHYIGSWERYSGRNDQRRSRLVYNQKAHQTYGKDDGVRPWLSGFVKQFGAQKTAMLLGDRYTVPSKLSAAASDS
ncbi:hypothetical protein MPSEU_000133900 [Mayamaea pseudoterrestris]|nr:hypothetical protein MPSEU_000133900 [Mayamaea pseudoterrestris]